MGLWWCVQDICAGLIPCTFNMCSCMLIQTRTQRGSNTHMHAYIKACTYPHTHIHMYILHMCAHITYMHAYTCKHACTDAHVCTLSLSHTHTHTHTHKRTHTQSWCTCLLACIAFKEVSLGISLEISTSYVTVGYHTGLCVCEWSASW